MPHDENIAADRSQHAAHPLREPDSQRAIPTDSIPEVEKANSYQEKPKHSKKPVLIARLWRIHRKRQKKSPPPNFAEKLTVFVTVVIAIVGSIQACIYHQQKTLMQSGGHQTDKLIAAAQDQADAAGDMADASQQFSDTAEDINSRTSDAVEQLKAAANNAKASIEATQKSFRADQRAWVGLGESRVLQFNATDPFKLAIPMVNAGKSPAVRAEGALRYEVRPVLLKGPPANTEYVFRPASAVPPGGRYVINVNQGAGITQYYEAITSGAMFLHVYGIFRYRDVYDPSIPRVTKFCLYYDRTDKIMAFCDEGNDMN